MKKSKKIIISLSLLTAIFAFITSIINLKADTITYQQVKREQSYISEDISIGYAWKKVKFKVVYLMDTYKWELGREDQLTSGQNINQVIKTNLPKVENFKSAIGIIAVGSASQEGKQSYEEVRASNRADAILQSIRTMKYYGKKEIYKLNLGQFISSVPRSPHETEDQRRVIVIGIMDKPNNMKLEEIRNRLYFAFENSKQLSLDVSNFSRFQLYKR